MCAAITSEQQSEAPSNLNRLLERIEKDSVEGQDVTITAEDAALLVDLGKRYHKLKFRDANPIAIDRAKEIVADQLGCKLSEAFKWIQRKASSKNRSFEEMVESILFADEMRGEREERSRISRGES